MNGEAFDVSVAWWALAGAAVTNYAWRAAGALMSGRVRAEGEFSKWITAITYALMAGLTVRLLMLPSGMLAQVPWWIRLAIAAVAMAVMLTNPARRLIPALCTGCALTLFYGFWRSGWA
ncbi:MAG: AzlD domain-containing protein [Alphaproteobacteria bacterium]|nr:AzlD domain-containing protein [Alphaproteobacteria bacterium]